MKNLRFLSILLFLQLCLLPLGARERTIRPGERWLDNRGEHINAHGGGVLYHKGTY